MDRIRFQFKIQNGEILSILLIPSILSEFFFRVSSGRFVD